MVDHLDPISRAWCNLGFAVIVVAFSGFFTFTMIMIWAGEW